MKVERKRIFISDLPETATQADVETAFKKFGNVVSVEIKKRKEIIKSNSIYFAYVNIEIDDRDLQQCFKHFANKKWFGQNLVLQIARESFLDRLKREREENDKKETPVEENIKKIIQHNNISNGIKNKFKNETLEIENGKNLSGQNHNASKRKSQISSHTSKETFLGIDSSLQHGKDVDDSYNVEETSDLIIKNNKGKIFDKHGLKIESVGNEPIIKIDKSQPKFVLNSSEANLKRLQSLNNLKKNYRTQKSVIQTALSQIDRHPKNKIIFDDNTEDAVHINDDFSRKHLFDDDQSDDESNIDFTIKEQFQGKKGQKLLALQSRYKNDKRFMLDSRFVDDNDEEKEVDDNENGEDSLKEEKMMEYEILQKILGKDISKPTYLDELKSPKKAMLRFDPTQPEHSKFEMKNDVEKPKKRKNKSTEDLVNKKKQEEKEVPEVSKETFYKVTDTLKETLHEKQEFSLLSMFGKSDDKDLENQETETAPRTVTSNKYMTESNPFKYDSSDDEDETQNIPNKNESERLVDNKINEIKNTHWSEPFFFKNDDYRLQEGFDFIEKMKVEENTEFSKLRRDLKEIVKAKVRNNQRKHKPFKKKLGGNKRKKMIRMKKALRR